MREGAGAPDAAISAPDTAIVTPITPQASPALDAQSLPPELDSAYPKAADAGLSNQIEDMGAFDAGMSDDLSARPDPTPIAVSATTLGNAWTTTTAACGDGTEVPIGESSAVRIVDGTSILGNSSALRTWVGGRPSVTVIFDPNVCPGGRGDNWSTAGFLIRGAQLVNGELLLADGTRLADINFLNLESDGRIQEDPGGPEDIQLSERWAATVLAAKLVLLSVSYP